MFFFVPLPRLLIGDISGSAVGLTNSSCVLGWYGCVCIDCCKFHVDSRLYIALPTNSNSGTRHAPGLQDICSFCYGDVGGAHRALVGARFTRQEVVDARVAKQMLSLAVQLRGVHVQVLAWEQRAEYRRKLPATQHKTNRTFRSSSSKKIGKLENQSALALEVRHVAVPYSP